MLIGGVDAEEAARVAGFEENPNTVPQLLSAAPVQMALELGLGRKLRGCLVPIAFSELRKLLTADSEAVRLQAIKLTIQTAGYVAPRQAKEAESDREPSKMSRDELHAEIDRLEREIAGRAKVIEPTPGGEPDQDADLV